MRILFISEYFYPRVAGGEVWSWDLCRGLAEAGHEVVVVTGTEKPIYYNRERIENILIHRVGTIRNNFFQRIKFMRELKYFLKEVLDKEEYDIVHIMGYIPLLPVLMSKIKGKHIWSIHSYLGKYWNKISGASGIINWMFEDFLLNIGCRKCGCQVPSSYIKNKIGNDKIKVFPNYVDTKEIHKHTKNITKNYVVKNYGVGKHQKVFCAVGSLQKVKGFDRLIEAISHTHNDYLIIVGDGPERENLQNMIKDYNLDNRVFLVGKKSRTETLKIMKSCDIFVSSSYVESFSYVMAEAEVLGKPIISSDTGIAREIKERTSGQIQILDDMREICNYWGFVKPTDGIKDGMSRADYADKFIQGVYGR